MFDLLGATEEDFAKCLIIESPNSCGQGYNPHHAENPHHAVLVEFGWLYSHTTGVRHGWSNRALHTYRYPGTDWVISIRCGAGWEVTASKLGSGRRHTMFGSQLRHYLKRKTKELRAKLDLDRRYPCPYVE